MVQSQYGEGKVISGMYVRSTVARSDNFGFFVPLQVLQFSMAI